MKISYYTPKANVTGLSLVDSKEDEIVSWSFATPLQPEGTSKEEVVENLANFLYSRHSQDDSVGLRKPEFVKAMLETHGYHLTNVRVIFDGKNSCIILDFADAKMRHYEAEIMRIPGFVLDLHIKPIDGKGGAHTKIVYTYGDNATNCKLCVESNDSVFELSKAADKYATQKSIFDKK